MVKQRVLCCHSTVGAGIHGGVGVPVHGDDLGPGEPVAHEARDGPAGYRL